MKCCVISVTNGASKTLKKKNIYIYIYTQYYRLWQVKPWKINVCTLEQNKNQEEQVLQKLNKYYAETKQKEKMKWENVELQMQT